MDKNETTADYNPLRRIIDAVPLPACEEDALSSITLEDEDSDPPTPYWAGREFAHLVSRKKACAACRGINIESVSSHEGYLHSLVYKGSKEMFGCNMCSIIAHYVEKAKISHDSPSSLRFVFRRDGLDGSPQLTGILATRDNEISFPISVVTREGDAAAAYGVPKMRDLTHTGSDSSFEVANEWLQQCKLHHSCSNALNGLSSTSSTLPSDEWPSRLVDVGAFPGASQDSRLVEIPRGGPCPEYVTLSYCWGKVQSSKHLTTRESLVSHMSRIQFDDLPRTIQDAITVTRKFSLRFIWIDSLCIVQRDKSDWEIESAKMGAIYSRSAFTIAADRSTDSNGGLFNERSETLESSYACATVASKLSDGQKSRMIVSLDISEQPYDLSIDPLHLRAWTYQERALSARILHFSEHRLYWECRHEYRAEDNIRAWKPDHTVSGTLVRLLTLVDSQTGESGSLLCAYYKDVVQEYSARSLTVPNDKLPAISGVAGVVGTKLGWRYVAGLWGSHLELGLSWHRPNLEPLVALNNGCPSWSWAAYSQGISFPHLPLHVQSIHCSIKLLDINIKLDGNNRYGAVREASLELSGRVRTTKVSKEILPANYKSLIDDGGACEVGYCLLDQEGEVDAVDCLCLFKDIERDSLVVMIIQQTGVKEREYRRKGVGEIQPAGSWFDGYAEQCIILV